MTRILYVDIDSLRADHLGCYGYHRNTSPVIDALAADGVRFDQCYISDGPCLPSRTALFSGRFGFHSGVVGHGGTAAQPFVEGPSRGFTDTFRETSWPSQLRRSGLKTATVSGFGNRHGAFHWYAGFDEIYVPAPRWLELADDVDAYALLWLRQHAQLDGWFLHVNYWDPHTPYRTPPEFGNPFAGDPLPAWLTEDLRRRLWHGYGPHSAQDSPTPLDSLQTLERWIDGYDTGIRYADEHIRRLLDVLDETGVLDDTIIMVSADHGECQGELNVWGDHATADLLTCRVPLVVRWPGLAQPGRVDRGLHYQVDWAATVLDLLGREVPPNWDGRSFARAFRAGQEEGRPSLVLSHGAWTCTRSVRWNDYLCMRVYHDGYMDLDPLMLFDVRDDPHEQHNLAVDCPDVVDHAMRLLTDWQSDMMLSSRSDVDPLMTVLREGGPHHVRGTLPQYAERLRSTGRTAAAERLVREHAADLQ